jgi:hypothetical protein
MWRTKRGFSIPIPIQVQNLMTPLTGYSHGRNVVKICEGRPVGVEPSLLRPSLINLGDFSIVCIYVCTWLLPQERESVWIDCFMIHTLLRSITSILSIFHQHLIDPSAPDETFLPCFWSHTIQAFEIY